MKKVLVTGASGFIGRNTLKLLVQNGYEVHTVSSKLIKNNDKKIHWHCCNLLDFNQIDKLFKSIEPTHLMHFAWYLNPKDYKNSEENLGWVQSSIEIIKCFKKYGGERLMFAGTCSEYDPRYGYLNEKLTPLKSNSLYGVCKAGLHDIVEKYCVENNLSLVWGRIFYIYGPYESPQRVISYIINKLLNGEKAYCSHGKQIRDYLYVDDVSDACAAIFHSGVEGDINIGSGNPISLKDMFMKIARIIGREDLVYLGKYKTSPDEASFIAADVKRLKEEVGWTPHYDLDRGLVKTIQWWKEQKDMTKGLDD